jgi:hypothetical protein
MHCTHCDFGCGVKSASTQHDDERKERNKRRKHAGKAFIGCGLAYFQATKLQHYSKNQHDEATDCVDESQARRRGFGRGRCCDGWVRKAMRSADRVAGERYRLRWHRAQQSRSSIPISKNEHDEATDCVDESQARRRGFGRVRCCDGSDIGFVGTEHSSLEHRFQFLSALLHVSCYCKFIDTGASLHHAHALRHSKV